MQVRFLLARFLQKFNNNINIPFNLKHYVNFVTKNNIKKLKVNYGFFFISLTSPFLINNFKLDYLTFDESKIFVKQSYLLLTWFYYISNLNHKLSKKRIKIATLPSIKKIFTMTKAPMAHKNWSKEQYKLQYFKFKISFKSIFKTTFPINSLNSTILFILISKKNTFFFETNIFFLKFFSIHFHFSDTTFFNYNSFLTNNNVNLRDETGRHARLKISSLTGSWFKSRCR